MIDRIVLTDFQAHAKYSLAVGPGVTVITGASDKGKSSILRALKWLCLNQPAGAEFVRTGTSGCNVALRVDGRWVQRRRDKKENVYQLGDAEPHQLERGGAVPTAVESLLNVSEINFAGQHDAPFWLADTPGNVAKALNDIVSLSEIDQVMAKASAGVRDARATAQAAERELGDAESELGRIPSVADASGSLSVLIDLLQASESTSNQCAEVRRVLDGLDSAAQTEAEFTQVVTTGDLAITTGRELSEVQRAVKTINRILTDLDFHDSGEQFSDVEWDRVVEARNACDSASRHRGLLEDALAQLTTLEDEVCRADLGVRAASVRLEELSRELGGLCPLCQQPATPEQFLSATPTSDPPVLPPEARERGGGVEFRLPTSGR